MDTQYIIWTYVVLINIIFYVLFMFGDEMSYLSIGDEISGDETSGDEMTGDETSGYEMSGDENSGIRVRHCTYETRGIIYRHRQKITFTVSIASVYVTHMPPANYLNNPTYD